MLGADVGCDRIAELVTVKDAICHVKRCAFNDVYQHFPKGIRPVLQLSYFHAPPPTERTHGRHHSPGRGRRYGPAS
ncbi:hypothetical protein CALVIDRAFT_567125 [Calocera viscosa TUFC12733]|uniref:Uncharacterized protein n=1 Tax=Calocera viscosa (strain TUFC12733) TaxID=1330018 RepID=A0A167IGW3_CALVF|nr:hypothetical protein CALVIDRAFT_567125 [Calocera viscosa TUFC12733]